MFLKPEERNIISGLLGTVSIHLIVLILFLVVRLDKVHNKHKEPLTIEFDDPAFKTLEQLMQEIKMLESDVKPLSNDQLSNIAVNTANQLEQKISTEKYIEELKQELNIDELNPKFDEPKGNEPVVQEENKNEPKKEKPKTEFYKGPTRISYHLEGRTSRYMHIPVYKCQGRGMVIINIVVNPDGNVISSSVSSTNTNEECIIKTALESAAISTFNKVPGAESRQQGTITYDFVAQ